MRRLALAMLVVCAVAATPATAAPLRFFQTSDGNIACAIFAGRKHVVPGSARCDIGNRSWPVPPRPKSCPYDYGQGLEVRVHRGGHYVCGGDTILHQGNMVGIGTVISKGRFTCAVLQSSVRCLDRNTKHGFEISTTQPVFF